MLFRSDLSILSRTAGGVIVMRLPEGQYVANFTVVAKEEKEDGETDTEEMTADIEAVEIEIESEAEVDTESTPEEE